MHILFLPLLQYFSFCTIIVRNSQTCKIPVHFVPGNTLRGDYQRTVTAFCVLCDHVTDDFFAFFSIFAYTDSKQRTGITIPTRR